MSKYTLQFCTSGWNETSAITAFQQGLNHNTHLQMAIYNDVMGLEDFIQPAIHISSQRMSACELDQSAAFPPFTAPYVPHQNQNLCKWIRIACPMCSVRIANQLCLYCGTVYLISSCPLCPPCPAVSTVQVQPMIAPLTPLW